MNQDTSESEFNEFEKAALKYLQNILSGVCLILGLLVGNYIGKLLSLL